MQPILNLLRNYELFLVLGLFALAFMLLIWNFLLQIRLNQLQRKNLEFFAGNNVKSIEDVIIGHSKSIKALDKDIQELYNISNQINLQAYKGLHKVAVIRYNPFKDVGGDQSFAIALLNGKNNGLTISSLYTREGARVYAKAITAGESEKYPLTDEEKQAIKLAKATDTKKI